MTTQTAATPDIGKIPAMPDAPADLRQNPPLREATPQEIQLELIRRSQYNALDGERVVDALLRHRGRWRAAWMTRLGVSMEPGELPAMSMIPLRDLPGGYWNVDTLFLLCPTPADAEAMAAVAEQEGWGCEPGQVYDQKESDNALGTGRGKDGVIVSFWWD